jgi:hypothetical protein
MNELNQIASKEDLQQTQRATTQQYNDEANDNKRIATQRTNNKADDNVLIDV